jgi:glycosyltransferase involved in cell wall biosynthesis
MRVLFVARWYPSHDSPGRGSFVADQAKALVAAGADVIVASWEPALITTAADGDAAAATWARAIERSVLPLATPRSWGAGVPVARLPAVMPAEPAARHPVDLARWQAATLVPFGRALAGVWPIDVVHAHTGLPDGFAAVDLADRLGVPLVTTEHDGSLDRRLADDRARVAYRTLVEERRGLIAVSARLADQMSELSGVDQASIAVIPNLIDRTLFNFDAAVIRDPTELLWVGSRKASKGMVELLEAFARVATNRPGLHLRMIGGAPTAADDADLLARAAHLGIADRVQFEPATSRADIAAAMARAGLFVHPSPSESFGIVAVEALAAGLPVVAVAPTVIDRIGRDGVLGEAATGSDAQSLAEAIGRALDRLTEFDPSTMRAATSASDSRSVASAILNRYRALGAASAGGATLPTIQTDATTNQVERRASSGPGLGSDPELGALAPTPANHLLVVAGRRRSALARIGSLAAATDLTVLTTVGADPLPAASGAAWIEIDPDAAWRAALEQLGQPSSRSPRGSWRRRLIEAALHPRRIMARRRLYAQRSDSALTARAVAVTSVHHRLGPMTGIVALDADDLEVIERSGLSALLAPAIMRWVADRHDAAIGNLVDPTPVNNVPEHHV